ncbi:MAG: hypothetical protein KAT11_07500 [Phycisphaerae bacterium]|nr:hypothetical protein [Phycisphaerae bacterium]
MSKPLIRTTTLAVCFALLVFCGASCRKPVNPEKLALMSDPSGSAPNPAAVIKIDPPVKALSPAPPEAQAQNEAISANKPANPIPPNWLMLVGVLLLLFLLSLILFHSLGRRLRKRTFRAHAPTRHADIWASHKPPQFFDP